MDLATMSCLEEMSGFIDSQHREVGKVLLILLFEGLDFLNEG